MNSRMLAKGSPRPVRSARRSATVTISAPLTASASRIASGDANLPVPRISRERNSRPAIVIGWLTDTIDRSIIEASRLCRGATEGCDYHKKPPSPEGAKCDSPGQSESASDALGTDNPVLLSLSSRGRGRGDGGGG